MKQQVSLSIEPELLAEINRLRGMAPLSTYINAILREAVPMIAERERA